ncbi:Ku protein [Kitasatospora sp. DSM 101779]|uniref:non-homologous end joining protein Ku n=1 Tax=Kitasatospora sp. DSM 101779 TaxID=2853165 RepID=UPI0021D8ECB2|nr:Ku protein [Kitasatospora sp. DSM 101779]MCU7827306.1 Ku protein [Kitasatospora sp. DSM 101779]
MARPVWTGVLSFGLVTVPVALYTATESHTVRFHQLERGTSDRVRNRRVNERTGEEVAFGDIVKGFEVGEGEYVVVEPDELEQISPGRSRTIDVSGFVDLGEVEPIFFDKTYYLGPKGKEYAKIYQLLTKVLERSNRAGLAMFSMRGKEYLTAVRAEDGLLELHTMHFADEVRDPRREVDDLPTGEATFSPQELQTAEQLVEMLAVDWDPEEYRDTFEEQVRKLIEDKQAGREITVSAGPAPESTNVIDLMDVLRRSVDAARSGKSASAAAGGQAEETAAPESADERAEKGSAKKAAGGRRGRASTPAPAAHRAPKARAGTKSTSTATNAGKQTGSKKRVTAGGKVAAEDLSKLTKGELYKRATDLDVPHRSTMTRDQLQDAVAKATRTGGRLRRAS